MPILFFSLLIAWVALQQDYALSTWCFGGLVVGVLMYALRKAIKDPIAPSSLPGLFKLVAVVVWDILRANIDVAGRVLGRELPREARFLWIPLDARSDEAIALLASIVTLTPGTLSADVSADRRWLLVHALHAPDPAALLRDIKNRYEAPLVRLFDRC